MKCFSIIRAPKAKATTGKAIPRSCDDKPITVFGKISLNCLITRGDQAWSAADGFGPDLDRTVSFAFFLQDLKDLEILPEVGDVIFWYENYYEVDGVVDNQYFVGKIPEYSYSEGLDQYGSSISVVCSTHLVPADKLGITKERM